MSLYRPKAGQRLMEIHDQLLGALGPAEWWPGSPLEVIIGAVLTQNTAWTNVEKALASLSRNQLLPGPLAAGLSAEEAGHRLLALSDEALGELIRPAGFYRIKARRLKAVLAFFAECCAFDLPWLAESRRHETAALRATLLGLTGVGPETADDILLYALKRPSFVVDAYTLRLFGRHSLLPAVPEGGPRTVAPGMRYESARRMFMEALPVSTALYGEYHALIVRACKEWCHKTAPNCPDCPLGRGLWAWQNQPGGQESQ